jgi:AcrR family transcriptional regulator
MVDPPTRGRSSPSRRPVTQRGQPSRDTRADIVNVARTMFAELGYERTAMRAVAARAGVDVALIYHHYGSKDGLLAAALSVPAGAQPFQRPLPADTTEPGKAVVHTVLTMWEQDPQLREQALAMIRTALSHQRAAQRLLKLQQEFVSTLISDVVADDTPELRAALIGAHLSGLLLNRYLFQVPDLATADLTVLVDAAGPVVDHLLRGDLGARASPFVADRQPSGPTGSRMTFGPMRSSWRTSRFLHAMSGVSGGYVAGHAAAQSWSGYHRPCAGSCQRGRSAIVPLSWRCSPTGRRRWNCLGVSSTRRLKLRRK